MSYEHELETAKLVLQGKARSYVHASKELAQAVIELEKENARLLHEREPIGIAALARERDRLVTVIKTGGAMYRAERAVLGVPGGHDPNTIAEILEVIPRRCAFCTQLQESSCVAGVVPSRYNERCKRCLALRAARELVSGEKDAEGQCEHCGEDAVIVQAVGDEQHRVCGECASK